MSGSPDWAVPAITASASLVGAVVGGLTTYWTSKKSYEYKTRADETRERYALLREAAIRFVASITDFSVTAVSSDRISQEWGPVIERVRGARTEQEFVEFALMVVPTIQPGETRQAILMKLLRETGALEDDMRRSFTLLTELRLLAPDDVADSALRVVYATAARELTAALAPDLLPQAADSFNREVNEFVNRVRHHMNVEDIRFDFINEGVFQELLPRNLLDPDERGS